MTQTQELIERLRDGVIYDDEGEILRVATKALMRAAADRLSQLEGEVGRLREALRNLCATLDRLGDNGVYVIDTGLAHAYAASLAALEHQQKGEKL